MLRPNCRAILRLVFEQVEFTLHLFKDMKLCMIVLYILYFSLLTCNLHQNILILGNHIYIYIYTPVNRNLV